MKETRNVIFMTSLNGNDGELKTYQEYSIKTWEYYAKKHDFELVIWTDGVRSTREMRATWQRWHVYDILDKKGIPYNQVALVDLDTMIKWDAPDIFTASKNRYSAVRDILNPAWNVESIEGYKNLFPDIPLGWDQYSNNGVIVLPSNTGKSFCNVVLEFFYTNQKELNSKECITLRRGSDQTPVNYLATAYFDEGIHFFSSKFNMLHLRESGVLKNDMYIKHGYIWHFNGLEFHERINFMEYTWNKIANNYK